MTPKTTKPLRDLFDAKARRVIACKTNTQIAGDIARPALWSMVDGFIRPKFSAKNLFHDRTMLKYTFPRALEHSITLSRECARPLRSSEKPNAAINDLRTDDASMYAVVRVDHIPSDSSFIVFASSKYPRATTESEPRQIWAVLPKVICGQPTWTNLWHQSTFDRFSTQLDVLFERHGIAPDFVPSMSKCCGESSMVGDSPAPERIFESPDARWVRASIKSNYTPGSKR